MRIKGAIFDLDGTLIDSLVINRVLWNALGEKYLGVKDFIPEKKYRDEMATMIFTEAMLYAKRLYNIEADDGEYLKYFADILENFYRYTVKVKDGVFPFLEYLKKNGVKMCVASATNLKYVEVAIESCGLSPYIDRVFSCSEVGAGKDKPDIYIKTIAEMGLDTHEVCVFEDSCIALETARALGAHTVGIYDKYNFGHDRAKKASDIYLDDGDTMERLIGKIFC